MNMRHKYLVSLELKTPWYLKLGRFLGVAKKKDTFTLSFYEGDFLPGDILFLGEDTCCIVIDKLK